MNNKYTESFGLNVHPTVFGSSVLIIISITIYTLLNLSETAQMFDAIQFVIASKAGWFYILAANIILGFLIYLIFSRYGKSVLEE